MLDIGACHRLLGPVPHGKIGSLPIPLLYFQLDAFLRHAAKNYEPAVGSIPAKLLEHNLRTGPRSAALEFLPIDAAATQKTDITFKAYFQHPAFARPQHEHRVVLHVYVTETDGLKRSISVPLQAIMRGWQETPDSHQGYVHTIAFLHADAEILEQWQYIGITSRIWLQRMQEHFDEVRSGSNTRFHAAWRTYTGDARVVLGSELIVLNHTYEEIMGWEEELVDAAMAAGNCLKMIPGGFKGLRLLHEHRLTAGVAISLEEREAAIAEYALRSIAPPRVPNLLLAKLWESDAFYRKVLAGRDDVLSPAQVLAIRKLAGEGKEPGLIADIVGARNTAQVKRVLTAKTYRRVS